MNYKKESPRIEQGAISSKLAEIQIDPGDGEEQPRKILCLSVEGYPFWIGVMVDPNQINPELRDSLIRFQKIVADLSWRVFERRGSLQYD